MESDMFYLLLELELGIRSLSATLNRVIAHTVGERMGKRSPQTYKKSMYSTHQMREAQIM